MRWLAIDIGGANVKAADGRRYAHSYAFPLWKQPQQLAQQLRVAIAEAGMADHLAITMTGELADCFPSRRAGVAAILDAVHEAAGGSHTRVYLVDGRLVTPQVARAQPLSAAASNWHALAAFAARFAGGKPALLVDVGSTTCDVIPLLDGKPAARGTTDTERMLRDELVYTGVERSPICAILAKFPWGGGRCPVAQEWFATTRDAYLILGEMPEAPDDLGTADGRPATRAAAHARLARMACADADEFSPEDAMQAAEATAAAQTKRLAEAMRRVNSEMRQPAATLLLSGHGEFLARRAAAWLGWKTPIQSLADLAGPVISRCGPAHALAVLAREAGGRE